MNKLLSYIALGLSVTTLALAPNKSYGNIPIGDKYPELSRITEFQKIEIAPGKFLRLAPPLSKEELKKIDENFEYEINIQFDEAIPALEDIKKEDGEKGLLKHLGSPMFQK